MSIIKGLPALWLTNSQFEKAKALICQKGFLEPESIDLGTN